MDGVLDELVPFLDAPSSRTASRLRAYLLPSVSDETRDRLRTCVRASITGSARRAWLTVDRRRRLERRHEPGRHDGRGESVWLAWFLASCSTSSRHSASGGNSATWPTVTARSARLHGMLEPWDGDWYRRAYFDDGTPLGSAQNDECKIDSLTQSWAVLSGVADPRARRTRDELGRANLIRRDTRVVLLLTPPFDAPRTTPATSKATTRRSRERRAIYPCRHLGRHGACSTGRGDARWNCST